MAGGGVYFWTFRRGGGIYVRPFKGEEAYTYVHILHIYM
jgi:hypothetical protein